jgi:hypothetical protein
MKFAAVRNPVFSQTVITLVAICLTAVIARVHRGHVDSVQAIAITEQETKAISQATLDEYIQRPFRLTTTLNHYEAVRDTEGRSPETARIFALGAERLRIQNNRLFQIVSKARQAQSPTDFIETNIRNLEGQLAIFLQKNRVIPAGSIVATEYDRLLLELELWRRAEQHLLEQSTVDPTPQNLDSVMP